MEACLGLVSLLVALGLGLPPLLVLEQQVCIEDIHFPVPVSRCNVASVMTTDDLPGERVVHFLDEFKIANRITAHGGTEVFGKLSE